MSAEVTANTNFAVTLNGEATANENFDSVPEIPHVTTNMVPFGTILDRFATDAYVKLKEYFKYMESSTEPEAQKKKLFLDMLVGIRENFVRLYVICKWTSNHEKVGKLIDLFVWLREQNDTLTNNILSFGAIKSSLISSKMPEPDLLTALEVLLQGRPDLPTYNFLREEKLSPEFVLKVLQSLNVELSIKMAMETNIPKSFHKYEIKNGCVYFNIPNYFSCSISILDTDKFHLIDYNFEFALESKIIKPKTEKLDSQSLHSLQTYSAQLLHKKGLKGLHKLLYTYAISSKIYLIHKSLVDLRMGLWRGHLTHTYDAEASLITITYWVQRNYAQASTIEISKYTDDENDTQNLTFKWFKNGIEDKSHNLELYGEDGSIDIVKLINGIINVHVKSIISQAQQNLVKTVGNIEKMIDTDCEEKLIFRVSQSKHFTFCIDSLSGSCYFENPSNSMNRSSYKINKGISLDFIEILRLKMLIKEAEFSSMMNATGWVNLKSVFLKEEEITKLNIDYSELNQMNLRGILTSLGMYRRKDWPVGWAICVGHFGFQSNVQLWCCKIQSMEGHWVITWSDEIDSSELNDTAPGLKFNSTKEAQTKSKDEPVVVSKELTYRNLINLIKLSSSKLISNLIVKELKEEGCEIKVMPTSDKSLNAFLSSELGIDNLHIDSTDNAVLLIKNQSLFSIQRAKASLVLLISIKNSELNARIYGQLLDDHNSNKLPDIEYTDENNTAIKYTAKSKMFKIESNVDLSNQIGLVIHDNFRSISRDSLILSNILMSLKKFTKSLNLLKLVSKDPKLTIVDVLPNGVTFNYNSETITLKISSHNEDELVLELPKDNPHYHHIQYLNEIINNGSVQNSSIKELVFYLTLTLKYCRAVDTLIQDSTQEADEFIKNNNTNSDTSLSKLKLSPDVGFVPMISNLEKFKICYFKTVRFNYQTTVGKKKVNKSVSDILRFDILVELRHRSNFISTKHSKFYITLGELRTDNSGPIKSLEEFDESQGAESNFVTLVKNIAQSTNSYFDGSDFTTITKSGNFVFAKDCICCDFESIDLILNDLHTRVYTLLKSTV